MFRCFKKRVDVKEVIKNMRQCEVVLRDMIFKYERIERETREKFKEEKTKSRKLIHLKKIKTLRYYIGQCETKIASCVHKQYALEQLEVTRMQIDAIKASTSIFKSFSKYNPVEKIEDLQEKMEENLEDLSDISDLLSTSTLEFDENELLTELHNMNEECDEHMMEDLPEVPSHVPLTKLAKPEPLPV